MRVSIPNCAVVLGSVTPPQGDVVDVRVHLGCTKEVSSFELTLQNWNKKFSPGGTSPILVGSDGSIFIGRGTDVPQLITVKVENVEYEEPSADERYLKVTGRCWGERLFRRVVNKTYLNQKGEAIVKDLMDSFAGLSHTRSGQELVQDTSTTYTKLDYQDTPLWDILKYLAETADLNGAIGYDFRVAPDGKFEFFPLNSKVWTSASLKLYLPFNEGSGSVAHDKSGNGNDGTLTGTLPWVPGKYQSALFWALWGQPSGYVTVQDSASLHINTQITICAWIKPTAQGSWNAIIHRNWAAAGTFWLGLDSGDVVFSMMNDAGQRADATFPVTLTLNQWHFIAATYDGQKLLVYVDGQKSSPAALAGTFSDYGPLIIGTHAGGPFEGTMDELRVYSEALGEDVLSAFYELGPPPLSGVVEVSGYKKDISRVRNRISVNGLNGKKTPTDTNEDSYTESLDNWSTSGTLTLDTDHVSEDGQTKYTDSYSVAAFGRTNDTSIYAHRTLPSLKCWRQTGYKQIRFWLLWTRYGSGSLSAATVRLYTDANSYFETDILNLVGPQTSWQKITLRTDQGTWTTVGSPSWDNINAIRVTAIYPSSGIPTIKIDHLLFSDCRYNAVETDGSSDPRELSETDEELATDAECDLRAKSLLAYYKDPAESLTVTSTVLDYGMTPILPGDVVHANFPDENVDGDYRVDTVEYYVHTQDDMTLEVTFELGKVAPLLADYLYGMRTHSITVEKLARTKLGVR